MKLDAAKLTILLTNLSSNVDYLFQVSANTRMGEGERTQVVSGSIQSKGINNLTFILRYLICNLLLLLTLTVLNMLLISICTKM